MTDSRLPAHLEISAIIRVVEAQGGFATVLAKGDRDVGAILLVTIENDMPAQLYERPPQLDGSRVWALSKTQDIDKKHEFDEYLERRRRQDRDLWIVELDIAQGQRFVESLPC